MESLLDIVREGCSGKYAVERELGRGGTAVVYLANDLRHRRPVALKVLDPELALVIGADRFRREIDIAAQLNHPHIVPLLDSGTIGMTAGATTSKPGRSVPVEVPYYVMPFVTGESLRDRLSRDRTLNLAEALRFTGEVADALDYAHRQGIVHRDIKPENILLSGGHAVVADFGIARALDRAGGGQQVTRTGLLVGTPNYMSPEQISGEQDLDGRSDLYSLGCVLYEMLTGMAPQTAGSVQALLARRLSEPAPRLRTSGVNVPPFVEAAVERALATDRAQRFATGAELAAALAAPPAGASHARSLRAASLAIPVVLIAALLAVVWWSRAHTGPTAVTSIAVLPLTEAATDSETAYLRNGIPEAVADRLRRLPGLAVTAPSLATQLLSRQPDADLRDIGRRLGVETFLAGRMRRWGDSLGLRAELVRVADGRLLWGETYEVGAADLMELERRIVSTIADTLRITLSGEQRTRLAAQPVRDPVAYDLFLRGTYLWSRATPLGTVNARLLTDSIRILAREVQRRAPEFAGGHFLDAAYYSLAGIRGWLKPFGPAADSAKAAALRAIKLDPLAPEAWLVLGIISFYTTDNWAESWRYIRRTVELDPSYVEAQYFYALYQGEVEGQLDSAITHLRSTISIDSSLSVLNSLGDLYIRAGKYDSAVTVLSAAVTIDPHVRGPRDRLIRALEATDRLDSAIAVRRSAPDTTGLGRFAAALAAEGPTGYRRVLAEDVRSRIDSIQQAMKGPPDELADTLPPLRERRLAVLYAELGDWRAAADWVLREHDRRPGRFRTALVDPTLAGIRTDPRIVRLARKERLRIPASR